MAKFAPVYMTAAYDGPDHTLDDLSIDNADFDEGAAEDTAIGTLSGMAEEDSTLSIVSEDGYVKLDGNDLVVGPNGGGLADGTFNATIRETNPYGVVTTHDTVIEITVNNVP